MGYSPGEFTNEDGQKFHWELSGGRAILWDAGETTAVLTLDETNAKLAVFHLSLLLEDELQTMSPVNYEAIVTAVINDDPEAPLEKLIGRAMQVSRGKANPAVLRAMFTLIDDGAKELQKKMLDELKHPSSNSQIGGLQLLVAENNAGFNRQEAYNSWLAENGLMDTPQARADFGW